MDSPSRAVCLRLPLPSQVSETPHTMAKDQPQFDFSVVSADEAAQHLSGRAPRTPKAAPKGGSVDTGLVQFTPETLKQLEDRLWEAADDLRANSSLSAQQYSTPVLGLIFLRYAEARYLQAKEQIEAEEGDSRFGPDLSPEAFQARGCNGGAGGRALHEPIGNARGGRPR